MKEERRPNIKDVSFLTQSEDEGAMLKRVVRIKTIVTDPFKQSTEKELRARIANLDKVLEQIDNQTQPMLEDLKKKNKLPQLDNLRKQIAQEKGKVSLQKKVMLQKIEEIKKLLPGSEYLQGNMESWVNIKVGDNLFKKVGGMEIVVKDGIVREIRKT